MWTACVENTKKIDHHHFVQITASSMELFFVNVAHICFFLLCLSAKALCLQEDITMRFMMKEMNHAVTKHWFSYLKMHLFHSLQNDYNQMHRWKYQASVAQLLAFIYLKCETLMTFSNTPVSNTSPPHVKMFRNVDKLSFYFASLRYYTKYFQW